MLRYCVLQNIEVEEDHVDERSVDDLLSFINGGDGGICLPPCLPTFLLILSEHVCVCVCLVPVHISTSS